MSEPQTPAPEAGAAPPKRTKLLILAAAGLLVGVLAGAFVAVPLFASRIAAPASAAAQAKGHAEEKKGEGAGKGAGAVYAIDNIVLNPAGTGGTRFLMLTVAFDLSDAKYAEAMKEHDAQARDALVSLFARKTVEQLADVQQRDSLRREASAAVAPLLPKGAIRRVYIPQFVIQ